MSEKIIGSFYFCAVLLSAIFAAQGSVPVLEWDSIPDPSIAGYNLYRGTKSRSYDRIVDVRTQTGVKLTGLDPGTTYHFAITAYNADRLESDFSDEVRFTPPVDGVTATTLPCALIPSDGVVTIQFEGRKGQQCRVLASPDLETWEVVYSVRLETNQVIQFQREKAPDKPMEFFRVVSSLPQVRKLNVHPR